MYATEERAGRDNPQPFLYTTRDRLEDVKQILYGVSEALGQAGFYPPPQPPSGDTSKPVESNVRHQLDETITRIHETAHMLREQVARLT